MTLALPGPATGARPEDVAWCAGLLDGDGCISAVRSPYKNGRRDGYRLRLDLAQNCHFTLDAFRKIVRLPAQIYPVPRTISPNRQGYVLVYADWRAAAALTLLVPHLCRKKPEAQVALDLWKKGRLGVHPGAAGHAPKVWKIREQLYRKLRNMK